MFKKSNKKIQKSIINHKSQKWSKMVKNIQKKPEKSLKISKNHFFPFFLMIFFFFLTKINIFFSFPIFGGCDWTRALQSSWFQKYENITNIKKSLFFNNKKYFEEKK